MGTLYLVATPIGNLGDLSPRAVETLKKAGIIAAEDTRHTRKLLSAAGIAAHNLVAYHEHNEKEQARALVQELDSGKTIALVCDSGTPGISDPGYRVVSLAVEAGHEVIPIPGPSAAIALLSASGLPTDRFLFVGFPPPKETGRRKFFEELLTGRGTILLHESPNRLAATLSDMADIFGGERRAVIGRELTKIHEEIVRGTLSELAARYADQNVAGEVVLAIEGDRQKHIAPSDEALDAEIDAALREEGLSVRDIADRLSKKYSLQRKQVYRRALDRAERQE